jgi:hypothetical protein
VFSCKLLRCFSFNLSIFSMSFRRMSQVLTYAKSIIFPSKQDCLEKDLSTKPTEDYYDHWEANNSEKELIKLTWSNDFDFLFTLGSNIYIYIFEHNPKMKELFPGVHQYGENWQDSKEFRKQALNFVQVQKKIIFV